ncbi:hypothetical protein CBL_14023 [Carabus blaptoides fortunei]
MLASCVLSKRYAVIYAIRLPFGTLCICRRPVPYLGDCMYVRTLTDIHSSATTVYLSASDMFPVSSRIDHRCCTCPPSPLLCLRTSTHNATSGVADIHNNSIPDLSWLYHVAPVHMCMFSDRYKRTDKEGTTRNATARSASHPESHREHDTKRRDVTCSPLNTTLMCVVGNIHAFNVL